MSHREPPNKVTLRAEVNTKGLPGLRMDAPGVRPPNWFGLAFYKEEAGFSVGISTNYFDESGCLITNLDFSKLSREELSAIRDMLKTLLEYGQP